MNVKKIIRVILFSLIGWGLCGAVMAIGREVTTIENTLTIHLVMAPIIFVVLSLMYFKGQDVFSPLATARIFTVFVFLIDFFVVALLIEKSFEMFRSATGTWIPFVLIYLSTFYTGNWIVKRKSN